MRDPARIGPMLESLRQYWEANPDLRLGQIISNMIEWTAVDYGQNIYYIEDEELKSSIDIAHSENEEMK